MASDACKTIFCGLPLFHVNAVLVTGLLPFSRGAHVILGTPEGYRGEGVVPRFWELVERHRINFFSAVPTLYAALLQQPTQGRDIRSLQYGLCGAAPMPVELMRNFQEKTGLKILEGYGLTEGACVSTCNPPLGERRLGSIGLRIPLQPMKAVVLDDSGAYVRDCANGEVGVLVIRGPNVFAGYKAPEHNKGLWVDAGEGAQWLNTGDLGRQDAEGYFYLTGRKKELIIRGGHNIDPASIEEPLHSIRPCRSQQPSEARRACGRGRGRLRPAQARRLRHRGGADVLRQGSYQRARRTAQGDSDHPGHAVDCVGKIFKPALKNREIEDALREALRNAGVLIRSINACSDPSYGTTVQVSVGEGSDAELARQVLGQFPFRFQLSDAALSLPL